MIEIGILVFLLLAAGYWTTLWLMGRREDVLHGQFVAADSEDELAPAMAAPLPALPPVPTRPKRATKLVIPAEPAPDAEALQSLLVSIKQELKNAAKM